VSGCFFVVFIFFSLFFSTPGCQLFMVHFFLGNGGSMNGVDNGWGSVW